MVSSLIILTVMYSLGLDKEFQLDDMLAQNHHEEDTYYHEYVRLYLANIALTSQVRELVDEKNKLAMRLSRYEVTFHSILG